MEENKIQSVVIEILQDNLSDIKKEARSTIKGLQVTVILLILLLVGVVCYYEWSFKHFINQYEMGTNATLDLDSYGNSTTTNNGNINIGK